MPNLPALTESAERAMNKSPRKTRHAAGPGARLPRIAGIEGIHRHEGDHCSIPEVLCREYKWPVRGDLQESDYGPRCSG